MCVPSLAAIRSRFFTNLDLTNLKTSSKCSSISSICKWTCRTNFSRSFSANKSRASFQTTFNPIEAIVNPRRRLCSSQLPTNTQRLSSLELLSITKRALSINSITTCPTSHHLATTRAQLPRGQPEVTHLCLVDTTSLLLVNPSDLRSIQRSKTCS